MSSLSCIRWTACPTTYEYRYGRTAMRGLLPLRCAVDQARDGLGENGQRQSAQRYIQGASGLDTVVLVLVGRHVQERRPAKEKGRHGHGEGRQVVIQGAEKAADTAQDNEPVHGGFHQCRHLRRVQQCGGKQGFRVHSKYLAPFCVLALMIVSDRIVVLSVRWLTQ